MSYRTPDSSPPTRVSFATWWATSPVLVSLIILVWCVGCLVLLISSIQSVNAARESEYCGPCRELCTAQGGRTLTCTEAGYESRCVCLTDTRDVERYGWDFDPLSEDGDAP